MYQIFTQPTAELSATALPAIVFLASRLQFLSWSSSDWGLFVFCAIQHVVFIDTLLGKQHIPEKENSIIYWLLWLSFEYFNASAVKSSMQSLIGSKVLLLQKAIIMKWLLKFHKQDILGTSWCISEHQELAGGRGRGGLVINDADGGAGWAGAAQSLLIRCNSSAQQQKQWPTWNINFVHQLESSTYNIHLDGI